MAMNPPKKILSNQQELGLLRSSFRPTPPPLCLIEKPDRGLSLIANTQIKRGEVFLAESPFIVFPKIASIPLICSQCFRVLPSEPLPCTKCKVARFCSERCLSLSHPSLLCNALPSLITGNYKWRDNLIFLLSAYSLPHLSLCLLLSLDSNLMIPGEFTEILHFQLTSLISGENTPLLFSRKNTSSLVSKEKVNSFSIPIPKDQTERFKAAGVPSACASGLYLWASMFNHSCMPNACQFVYVDNPQQENNTNLVFRALHEIEKGSKINISYLQFSMRFRERQEYLRKHYGFQCNCLRCRIEGQLKLNQEEQQEEKEDKKETEEKNKEVGEEVPKKGECLEKFVALFFNRFICVCGAFMAPSLP